MYGGMLPDTGGFFLNPLRALYLLIALFMFGGAWVLRRASKGEEQTGE